MTDEGEASAVQRRARRDVLEALSLCPMPTAARCARAVQSSTVSPQFPPLGQMSVGEAAVLYGHRRGTMLRGGIGFEGVDEVLEELARRDPSEVIRLAGYQGERETYLVFLDARGAALGCVRVDRGGDG